MGFDQRGGSLMNTASAGWLDICALDEIWPNVGVAALVQGRQIAVFRIGDGETVYAIDNHDPQSGANVLSRGLTGSLNGRTVVASPIYKQHYDLATGECLEDPAMSVRAYPAKVEQGRVWVSWS